MKVLCVAGNIAGSMGLFLGMSTVTLLEIFIYMFKSVWGAVNTDRKKQFEEKERKLREEMHAKTTAADDDKDTSNGSSNSETVQPREERTTVGDQSRSPRLILRRPTRTLVLLHFPIDFILRKE